MTDTNLLNLPYFIHLFLAKVLNASDISISGMVPEYCRAIGLDCEHIPSLYLAYLVDVFTNWQCAWKESNRPKSAEAIKEFRKLTDEINAISKEVQQ